MMKLLARYCLSVLGLGLLCGCTTLHDPAPQVAAREDMHILRENLNRLQGRVETVELENRRLAGDLERKQDGRNEAALQDRLDNLERQVQALNTARAQDKQAIVDQLSAKMAEILSRERAARLSSGEGDQHTVQPGETLSAIAAAYKVKTSALAAVNNIANPDSLRAGQKLIIPR